GPSHARAKSANHRMHPLRAVKTCPPKGISRLVSLDDSPKSSHPELGGPPSGASGGAGLDERNPDGAIALWRALVQGAWSLVAGQLDRYRRQTLSRRLPPSPRHVGKPPHRSRAAGGQPRPPSVTRRSTSPTSSPCARPPTPRPSRARCARSGSRVARSLQSLLERPEDAAGLAPAYHSRPARKRR